MATANHTTPTQQALVHVTAYIPAALTNLPTIPAVPPIRDTFMNWFMNTSYEYLQTLSEADRRRIFVYVNFPLCRQKENAATAKP